MGLSHGVMYRTPNLQTGNIDGETMQACSCGGGGIRSTIKYTGRVGVPYRGNSEPFLKAYELVAMACG